MSICDRLKEWRTTKGLFQKDAAHLLGLSPGVYQKYEMGISAPGSGALEAFCNAGLNINWLLTGQGEMLLTDQEALGTTEPPPIDKETLLYVIEGVETYLAQHKLTLKPDRKALLIQLIYEYCSMDTSARKPGTVERFLKLVA